MSSTGRHARTAHHAPTLSPRQAARAARVEAMDRRANARRAAGSTHPTRTTGFYILIGLAMVLFTLMVITALGLMAGADAHTQHAPVKHHQTSSQSKHVDDTTVCTKTWTHKTKGQEKKECVEWEYKADMAK
jgi:hypothetical protein